MNAIVTAIKEVYGLFVEDGSYAAGILIWLVFAIVVFAHVQRLGGFRAPILLAGLLALLVENVVRSARRLKANN
jgi:predicted PurR-regulated permease PerM